jgi:hypothetical protein
MASRRAATEREINVIPALELPITARPLTRRHASRRRWQPLDTLDSAEAVPGGTIYDIVNEKGEMSDRLHCPPATRSLVSGKGKVVYLSMRDAKGIHLARVRLR